MSEGVRSETVPGRRRVFFPHSVYLTHSIHVDSCIFSVFNRKSKSGIVARALPGDRTDLHLAVNEGQSHNRQFEPRHKACRRNPRRRIIRRRRSASLAAIGTRK